MFRKETVCRNFTSRLGSTLQDFFSALNLLHLRDLIPQSTGHLNTPVHLNTALSPQRPCPPYHPSSPQLPQLQTPSSSGHRCSPPATLSPPSCAQLFLLPPIILMVLLQLFCCWHLLPFSPKLHSLHVSLCLKKPSLQFQINGLSNKFFFSA